MFNYLNSTKIVTNFTSSRWASNSQPAWFFNFTILFSQKFLFNLYSWKNICYRLKLLKYILLIIVKYHIKPSTKKKNSDHKLYPKTHMQ